MPSGIAAFAIIFVISLFRFVNSQALTTAAPRPSSSTTTSEDALTTTLAITVPPPEILGPSQIEYCAKNLISWANGLPPYHFIITPTNNSVTAPSDWAQTLSGLQTTWFNDRIPPGEAVNISIIDEQDRSATKYLVVAPSNTTTCQQLQPTASSSTSTGPRLSPAGIFGIVLAVIFLSIGAAFWYYRRKTAHESRIRIVPYAFDNRKGTSDNQSILSSRSYKSNRSFKSAASKWSAFSTPRSDKAYVEDGVRVQVDTMQVTDDPSSPNTAPQSGIPLFDMQPRRTTVEWSGYPLRRPNHLEVNTNVPRDQGPRPHSAANPEGGPVSLQSAISNELSQLGLPTPTHTASDRGHPGLVVRNPGHLQIPEGRDVKSDPLLESNKASPVSPALTRQQMETLADLVAERLSRRAGGGSSPEPGTSTARRNSEAPPDYE